MGILVAIIRSLNILCLCSRPKEVDKTRVRPESSPLLQDTESGIQNDI